MKTKESYKYTLSNGSTILETTFAETLNDAASMFDLEIEHAFFGMAVLKSKSGGLFGVKWEAVQ